MRNQSDNNDIPEEPGNSSLPLLLFEFNNFSVLIDIIDNIIYASGTCHQNSNQWQCSIIVTCDQYNAVSRDADVYQLHIYVSV